MDWKTTRFAAAALVAAGLAAGCSINVDKGEEKGQHKKVDIETPLGGLKVRTDDVKANDTGLSVYPGATLAPKDQHDNENKGNVNINTPWFGMRVVVLRYVTDDAKEKVWDYYRKEMAQYGRVLECKPGSPDLDLEQHQKDQLTCHDKGERHAHVEYGPSDMELKVGTEDRQRIVAVKTKDGKTEFALVYLNTRGGEETM